MRPSLPLRLSWVIPALLLASFATTPLVNAEPTTVAAPPKSGDLRTDTKSGGGLVFIPAGEFWMGVDTAALDQLWKVHGWPDKETPLPTGEEGPRHKVKLSSGFWMGRTEVTVGQFRKFCQDTERKLPEQPIY